MRKVLLIVFISFTWLLSAQEEEMLANSEKVAAELKKERRKQGVRINRATKYYERLGYTAADDIYEKIAESNLSVAELAQLANAHRLNHRTVESEFYYAKLIQQSEDPEYILRYAQALQSNGKCEDALRWFDKFESKAGEEAGNWDFQIDCEETVVYAWHPEVGINNFEAVNTKYLDFAAMPFKKDLIITSNRKWKSTMRRKDLWTKNNFTDLFLVNLEGGEKVDKIKLLRGELTKKFHDGVVAVEGAGKKLYFTRNNENGRNEKDEIELKIYEISAKGEGWDDSKELPFNGEDFSTAHPTLSPDGQAMIFASNRPGGFGGMDLYITHMKNGAWEEPISLGPEVNSAGNELFPNWAKDGTVYFSSEGHQGLGGLDIFAINYQVVNEEAMWNERLHLGWPINSEMDDFSFYMDENGEKGLLASDRPGGKGGDDIYNWTAPGGLKFFRNKKAIVRDIATGELLGGVTVTYHVSNIVKKRLSPDHPAKKGDLKIPDLLITPQNLNSELDGAVRLKVHQDLEYVFSINQLGYKPYQEYLDGILFNSNEPVYLDLVPLEEVRVDSIFVEKEVPVIKEIVKEARLAEGIKFTLEDIYYDFDKWFIRDDASIDLNMLFGLLQKYPGMEVQLEAHTDSRGTAEYNLELSKQRVRAAEEFLVRKGINAQRIRTAHFGESQLINECSDGVTCTEEKHQANRRTEVRVTKFPYEPKK